MMTDYTLNQQIEIAEKLVKAGWTFETYSYNPTKGWWRLKDSDDPVKVMQHR